MTVTNYFESYGEFWRKSKKSKNDRFLVIFVLILAVFSNPSHTLLMSLRTQEHFGCRLTVLNFVKNRMNRFEKFEIFIERSGEKGTSA